MNHTEVLIVGAGPTGLTLACDLTRRNIPCRIIERNPVPQGGSRGFTLKPRSLEVFDDLGIADRIVAAAAVQSRTRFHLGEPLLFDLRVPPAPPSQQRPYPNSLAIPEWRTEALLRERLAELGGEVEFGRRLVDFHPGDNGVTATLERDGATETVRAAYLVGADGGRSSVRRRLGLTFAGSTDEDARAMLADAHVHGLDHSEAVHFWMAAGGHILALRPTPHAGTWQVVASVEPRRDGSWPEASLDYLQQAVTERTGRSDIRLTNPTWLSVWRYNLRMVDTYRVGRVFLAGDAAHVHSPFGGFGMNTGIQDAYNLGWKLALVLQGAANAALLDTYGAERLPVARAVLAESDRRFSAATPPRLLRPLLRFILKPFFARQQRGDRNDHPAYRTSPLSLDLAGRRKPVHASDVAPDGPVLLDAGATHTRLFDLFRDPHFTMLAFGSQGAQAVEHATGELTDHLHAYTVIVPGQQPPAGTTALIDTEGLVRRAYGAREDTLIVIRPDGYIGLIAHGPTDHAVRGYLDRTLLRSTGTATPPPAHFRMNGPAFKSLRGSKRSWLPCLLNQPQRAPRRHPSQRFSGRALH
ncbi:2-polyprenyl-6-methoxyphenol hydroxylase-like FAD-dependent oxidoreductase [Streptosporangium album]|uniref:2-polyprenyl-6-methoxyphenol hydroxylase-like FAD-dependent oxidoreductase n=1 Tax=Streptosporangium album TaxID=47479 RepID=A0A7W7W8T3_9ACTN|nr:FAD-dependent monooxygenase [Streptosporangium album]MBB4938278.1 2-polyprenyl-6-methoxyphenol hydroxylase-like FAD-dependent oxidoreductase [Streptosporangium album]